MRTRCPPPPSRYVL